MIDKGFIFNIQKFSIHDGPGIRTVIFFAGCPLRCQWCANPESQVPIIAAGATHGWNGMLLESKAYTLDEVLHICLQDKAFYEESGGGVTLSGGEMLIQAEFAGSLLKQFKAENIHTAIETSAYAPVALFSSIIVYTDLLLFDIKHYNNECHRDGTGVDNTLILENLTVAITNKCNILPRIPVIPGYNDSLDDALGFSRLLKKNDLQRVQLLPFHQGGSRKYELLEKEYQFKDKKQLHKEELETYRLIFINNGIDCFF
ncbi:putative pyruvate formate-lyase activating enzyme [Spirochaetia bacterium]|nr:putative pyruvate formate-lyase activating enzyme [Spirochaetia bacterium]